MHILRKKGKQMGRLIIDGGNVYELDEECLREKMKQKEHQEINSHLPECNTAAESAKTEKYYKNR